jgi:hypothetical protein
MIVIVQTTATTCLTTHYASQATAAAGRHCRIDHSSLRCITSRMYMVVAGSADNTAQDSIHSVERAVRDDWSHHWHHLVAAGMNCVVAIYDLARTQTVERYAKG